MPTRHASTWLNDQRKDYINPKEPKQRNCPKQLQTDNLPTKDAEDTNSTHKVNDILLTNKPRIVLWRTERMPQRIQRHSKITLHRSTHRNESKTRRKNLAMAWIDYKKVNGMVPQRWILYCLKIYKISHEVINFIEKTMQTWIVELTAGGRRINETKIQRGIFEGDAQSPLLFIIAMMPLNHMFRKCTTRYRLSWSQEKLNHGWH